MIGPSDFYDDLALLERLSTGLKKRKQEVVFLLGAPLSAPARTGEPGVPDVAGMIELIHREFDGEPGEKSALDQALNDSGGRIYQAAFSFLQGRRGQQTINEIVCRAVLAAREDALESTPIDFTNPGAVGEFCRSLELDFSGWHLNVGTENLGKLIAEHSQLFGKTLLTTNFDPLIEVAIRRAGGRHYRTVLHSDGNLSQTEALGCHVIHLHGYWFGADTLHTARQLGQPRPHLKDSLRSLLRNKLVVVCAYGGWDDVFTDALMDVVRDFTEYPEVIWTFHSEKPTLEETLSSRLGPGIDRGRVNLYAGIDCQRFFPELYERWSKLEDSSLVATTSTQSNPVHVREDFAREVQSHRHDQLTVIEGDDQDRPPLVEICVGREDEFKKLQGSDARIVFLTGMGGQGKSTIAARYFTDSLEARAYSLFVWRDCKEERERFENQLSSVIERLSEGKISGEDLAQQSTASIVEILVNQIKGHKVLFAFDNADHYVNLETASMTGTADVFVNALLLSGSESRAVFTCRPQIVYNDAHVLSVHLEGLSLDASVKLFSERGAVSSLDEIAEAHRLTDGHAFWLDLLAIQVGRQHGATKLQTLVSQIASGSGLLPEKTLNSIWSTLRDRERIVLSAMAESVKPVTEMELGDYLNDQLTFNKVTRTLNNLRTLNLIVVKRQPNEPDVLELHPLVRLFIRNNFPEKERLTFIGAIIKTYQRAMMSHKSTLNERPSLLVLQYWTQSVELDVRAGKFEDAFFALTEVAEPFLSSAYRREFSRVTRMLLEAVDWVATYNKYKEFDYVFHIHLHILADLGENSEVDRLLDKYEVTVANKDTRYINYCDLRCYASWVRGEFENAIEWGRVGQELKTSSGVDTKFDVSHNLALALRDAGRPESALPIFLHGRQLSQVTDPDELEEARGGHYYGNIGRCLHFMGQIEGALSCYQKSGLILEKSRSEHVINQGFIRAWIAELLVSRKQFRLAYAFYKAAHRKWKQIAPPRAAQIEKVSLQLKDRVSNADKIDDSDAERVCIDWILGKSLDQ